MEEIIHLEVKNIRSIATDEFCNEYFQDSDQFWILVNKIEKTEEEQKLVYDFIVMLDKKGLYPRITLKWRTLNSYKNTRL